MFWPRPPSLPGCWPQFSGRPFDVRIAARAASVPVSDVGRDLAMLKRPGTIAVMILSLTGCAASWLNSPSRATEDLVHDLKLEGFSCMATLSSVQCLQIDPYIQRQPKVCTSSGGCVSQPCVDIRMLYEIRQDERGVPKVIQTTERKPTTSIPTEGYSEEQMAQLREYCALEATP